MNHSLITLTTKRGKILNAFASDSITREISAKGEYDGNALDSLADVLAAIQPDVSLDVGANIGNHALVIADYSRRVLAFEPIGFVFDALKANIGQNRAAHVEAINAGLSDRDGEAEIFISNDGNLGASSLETAAGNGERLKIRTRIGDQCLAQFQAGRVDFIKMDVEGHEVEALRGLANTIAQCQPLLLIEYKTRKTIEGFQSQDLFNTLFSGYAVFSVMRSDDKKLHDRSAIGRLQRIRHKLMGGHWVLSSFDPERRYSNIYLVPSRHQSLFNAMPFMKARGCG
ncbi:MAG: FkbM family methyltransferase [Zoogloeaceae bacterium]|jgi:FkbM family methyltransferase|nr:FkbM family methyltransferase [Zoogloeaceae bacterium]